MANSNRTPAAFQVNSPGYGYGLWILLLNIVLTAVFWWQLPPQIPLFYSLPYGVNQLVSREWFFLLPLGSLIIWITYFMLARWSVNSSIYINILKWLHILCLFLFSLSIIHILWVML